VPCGLNRKVKASICQSCVEGRSVRPKWKGYHRTTFLLPEQLEGARDQTRQTKGEMLMPPYFHRKFTVLIPGEEKDVSLVDRLAGTSMKSTKKGSLMGSV